MTSAEAIADARRRFEEARDEYESAGKRVAGTIRTALRQRGIACEATARTKTIASFVGKAWRKGYSDPWAQTTDKVGVRVIVDRVDEVDQAVAIIRENFQVKSVEDKTADLWEKDRIGYSGIHVQVVADPPVGGECEIQVRTAAMNLWSDMSHRLVYKPTIDLSGDTKRALLRLQALTEIFDEEVRRAMEQISADPASRYSDLVSSACEVFYRYNENDYDQRLSAFVCGELGSALDVNTVAYSEVLARFDEEHGAQLAEVYSRYRDRDWPLLIHQPESVLIFEQIASAQFSLEDNWPETLPRDELASKFHRGDVLACAVSD